ncbi:FAD-dependent oxidoreductase [Rhodoferax sp.]|uniref:FAD-dependent oxidoreductase n=1 Tax=Rhodoferax sp. TaxID=50421 RepID=UPI002601265A|nr:FAD-dependent oxidoreductase [Rhodoferax sp.]
MAGKRIGIAGAGVLGRLLAVGLSRAGHVVQVFDPASGPSPRADSGSLAAGWTAAGMLSPVAELERAGDEVFALGVRSCQLWPQIVQGLADPVTLHMQGSLLLAHRSDAGAAQRVVGLLQAKADSRYQPQLLTAEALRALEPSIQGTALAWLLPCEGQIHPIEALQALAVQASAQGVQWHWNCQVTQVEAGVLHVVDARHTFDHVFDVRGVGAKSALPVRGVRGEVFWLHAPGVPLHRPVRLLHPRHSIYMVPRPGDVIVVGASEIESEDRSPVSLRSTLELLSAAHSVMPALAEARVVHLETNLRPALPDNRPVIRHRAGTTEINGLFRHGWLIAPALVEQALHELAL